MYVEFFIHGCNSSLDVKKILLSLNVTLCSGSFTPHILALYLIRLAKPSAQIEYNNDDRGHPCLIPLDGMKGSGKKLLPFIMTTDFLNKVLIHCPKPLGMPIFSICSSI